MDSDDQPPKKRMKLDAKNKTKKVTVGLIEKSSVPDVNWLSLSDGCILNILQYLTIMDLFRLSQVNSRLKMVILQNELPKRLIDFNDIDISWKKVFDMFGKYMVQIKIGEKHVTENTENTENQSKVDEILHQIRKHCTDGKLKHVDFEFCDSTTIINEAILKNVLPSLRNIESFEISESTNIVHRFEYEQRCLVNVSINNFIDCVMKNATNIKSAKFQNFRVNGGWLAMDHMKNVEILSFINCTLEKNACLIAFMQRKPALSSFTWRNSSVDRVIDQANFVLGLVGNNVPYLKALNFEKNRGCFENNLYVENGIDKPLKCQFLVQLNELKELTISLTCEPSSVSKLNVEHMSILAERNSVEKLSISFPDFYDYSNYLSHHNMAYLQNFTMLKYVEITSDINSKYYRIFFSNLPNLKECCLNYSGRVSQVTIEDIVESAKTISILKFKRKPIKFPATLYSAIVKIRTKNLSDEPLQIYIDESPHSTLMVQLKRKYQPNIVKLIPFNCK